MKKIILIIILMIGGIIMKAIKKVEVVPLDYNIGKIINSASSSDDKTKNTYSMRIVDKKISDVNDYVDNEISEVEQEINDLTNNVYVKDNYAKISGNISSSTGMSYLTLTLPTGFTQSNSIVIGYQWSIGSSRPIIVGNNFATGSDRTNNYIAMYYTGNNRIEVAFNNITSSTFTFYIDVLLLKIS